jgi:hypothetical protein
MGVGRSPGKTRRRTSNSGVADPPTAATARFVDGIVIYMQPQFVKVRAT